jgi:hypothetical protein
MGELDTRQLDAVLDSDPDIDLDLVPEPIRAIREAE